MTGTERFGPDRRLPDKAAFDHVFAAPEHRLRRHPLSLLARSNTSDKARLGMVVGKRHARRAADRNRIRRALRERFRRLDMPQVDIIVLARPGAGATPPATLGEAIDWLFERLAKDASRRAS